MNTSPGQSLRHRTRNLHLATLLGGLLAGCERSAPESSPSAPPSGHEQQNVTPAGAVTGRSERRYSGDLRLMPMEQVTLPPVTVRLTIEVPDKTVADGHGAQPARAKLEGSITATGEGSLYEGEARIVLVGSGPSPGRGYLVLTRLAPDFQGQVLFWHAESHESLTTEINPSSLKETPL